MAIDKMDAILGRLGSAGADNETVVSSAWVHITDADHGRWAAKAQGAPAARPARVNAEIEIGHAGSPAADFTPAPATSLG